ncbi:MAG: ABC transporter permease [Candidatus Woesearchaeota archaeon]|nr:ABC transporter permease [Candidatus Woesearchaeota archaeon]
MIRIDLLKYSISSLRARKRRSFLTILSVFIGIAAITTLISFGQGISAYVEQISQEMGNDKLMVQARGFGFGPPSLDSNVRMDETDLEAIRGVKGVSEATGMYIITGEVQVDDQKKYGYLTGSDYKNYRKLLEEIFALDLAEGNTLQGNEKSKVLLGYNYQLPEKIFEKPLQLRDKILINNHTFEVAGFYEAVGNPQDDSNIYITKEAMEDIFTPKNYLWVLIRAAPGVNPTELAEDIKDELRDHRHQDVGEEDFYVQSFEQVIATFKSILSIITGVVILIAFISVFVAAVNITNTMYTATLERTKEIGVFKAIGAKNSAILFVFILEAGVLSLIGGIIGVILGYLLSSVAGTAIAASGFGVFTPLFTWQLVVGSLVFAFLIGALSGLLPAYQASKLKPVDALRYE